MGGRSINTEQPQINSSVHCASATSVLLLAWQGALTLERSLIITKWIICLSSKLHSTVKSNRSCFSPFNSLYCVQLWNVWYPPTEVTDKVGGWLGPIVNSIRGWSKVAGGFLRLGVSLPRPILFQVNSNPQIILLKIFTYSIVYSFMCVCVSVYTLSMHTIRGKKAALDPWIWSYRPSVVSCSTYVLEIEVRPAGVCPWMLSCLNKALLAL